MEDKISVYGQCCRCKGDDFPLAKFGGRWYCKFCLKVKKDSLSSTIKAIEKPVDDFNKLVRKTK